MDFSAAWFSTPIPQFPLWVSSTEIHIFIVSYSQKFCLSPAHIHTHVHGNSFLGLRSQLPKCLEMWKSLEHTPIHSHACQPCIFFPLLNLPSTNPEMWVITRHTSHRFQHHLVTEGVFLVRKCVAEERSSVLFVRIIHWLSDQKDC